MSNPEDIKTTKEAPSAQEEIKNADTETRDKINNINESIENEKSLYDSLDKFSLENIYEIKQGIGEEKSDSMDIKTDENDAENIYGKAGLLRKFEHFINPGFTGGKKYLEEKRGVFKSKERGLLDRSKSNKEISGKDAEIDYEKAEEEFKSKGIGAEFKEKNSAKYELVDNEIVKRIEFTRTKTEQERIDEAGKLLADNLNNLEGKGGELSQLKNNFEIFKREKEIGLAEMQDDSDLKHYEDKLQGEEDTRKENIENQETELQEKLDIYKEPLNEKKAELNEAIGRFSGTLEGINSEEKGFKDNIHSLNAKIRKFSKFKQAGESFKDKIDQWGEEKKQAEANLAGFQSVKSAVKHRLDILKNSKREVDQTLKRINRIGKTEKEVKKEKVQEQKEAEQVLATGESESSNADSKGVEVEDVDVDSKINETEHTIPSDKIDDAIGQKADAIEIKDQEDQKNKKIDKKSYEDVQEERAKKADQKIEKEMYITTTEKWLGKLNLGRAAGLAKQVIESYFKKNGQANYDNTVNLTLPEAKNAYVQYLTDMRFRKLTKDDAIKEAKGKFNQIKRDWQ